MNLAKRASSRDRIFLFALILLGFGSLHAQNPTIFTAPAVPLGSRVVFELHGVPGQPYVFDASVSGTSPGTFVGPGLTVPLNRPFLLLDLFQGVLPAGGVLSGFAGAFDMNGDARAEIQLPDIEGFDGLVLSGVVATLDPFAPFGIGGVSPAADTRIVRPGTAMAGNAAPFLASTAVPAGLAVRYVAPTGSDLQNGLTPATAWRQISHAVNQVGPGTVIEVADGAYAGPVLIQNLAGTIGAPLVVRATGAGAVLTGSGSTNNTNKNSIFIGSSSWVTIEGLKVYGSQRAGCRVSLSHHVTIRNSVFGNHQKWGIFTDYADDLVLVGNECFGSIDEHGIYCSNSSDRNVIVGNWCRDNNASGIQINADPAFLAPIGGYVPDGISSHCVVERNRLTNNGVIGGAALNMASLRDSVIRNNVVTNSLWLNSSGIALWDDAAGAQWGSMRNLIEANTIAYDSGRGRFCITIMNGSIGNTIRNNVLRGGRRGALTWTLDSLPGLRSDGNLMWSVDSWPILVRDDVFQSFTLAQWQATGQDIHSIHAAPVFAQPAGLDWSLLPGTPGHDAAVFAATVLDHQGTPRGANPPDMGAYER